MDLLTLTAVNLLLGLAVFLSMAYQADRQRNQRYWAWFAASGAALFLNSLLGLLRQVVDLPYLLLPVLANLATVSLHLCLLYGVGHWLQRPVPRQLTLLLLPLLAVLHLLPALQQQSNWRVLLCFAVILGLNLRTLWLLLQIRLPALRIAQLLLVAALLFNLSQMLPRWLMYLTETLLPAWYSQSALVHQLGFFCLTIFAGLLLAAYLAVLVQQQQQALQQQAQTDALTGLLNRHQLEQKIQALLNHSQRRHQQVAVLVFDLDHFKQVNDRFGHSTGDAVLKAVADCARASCRDYDLLFRLGGEEFLLCLADAGPDEASQKAEQLRRAVRQLHLQHNWPAELHLSISIGFTSTSGQHPVMQLIEQADAALYRAKQAGRDRAISHTDILQRCLS